MAASIDATCSAASSTSTDELHEHIYAPYGQKPVPSMLTWWWLAFLASMIARAITTESVHALAVLMTFGLASRPLDQIQPTSGIQSLADLLSIVAGLLALRIVRLITARQEARAARLAASPPHTL